MVAVDMWEEEYGEHNQAHNPHFLIRHQRKSVISSREGADSFTGQRPDTSLGCEVGDQTVTSRINTAANNNRPGTHAGNRPSTNIDLDFSRPGTHARSRGVTPFSRSAVATPGMQATKPEAIVERGDGVWDLSITKAANRY